MLTLVSTEMQQQHANEITKQQILKIRQENAKMESPIILTNTKVASEPLLMRVLLAFH